MSKKGSNGGKATAIINRKLSLLNYYKKPNICAECFQIIKIRDNEKASATKLKKFCTSSCSATFNNKRRKRKKIIRKCNNKDCEIVVASIALCDICSINRIKEKRYNLEHTTKKELFSKYKHYGIGRSRITKHARQIFKESKKNKKCCYCGYSHSVDVCHIKDVKDFNDYSLIKDINCINNLIPLCKNHHWEFDNNYLELNKKGKLIPTKKQEKVN